MPPVEIDAGRDVDPYRLVFIHERGAKRAKNIDPVAGADDGQLIGGRDGKSGNEEKRNKRINELTTRNEAHGHSVPLLRKPWFSGCKSPDMLS